MAQQYAPDHVQDWDVDLKYTILWPTQFKGLRNMARYAGFTTQEETIAVSLANFTVGEDSPKPNIHVFGETNQGSEHRPHEYSWACSQGENTDGYLMLRWLQANDEYFDINLGAWDAQGVYLGIWGPTSEEFIGCLVESRGTTYMVKSLPMCDFRGSFKRVISERDGTTYGHGRRRTSLPAQSDLPWVKFRTTPST